MLKVNIELRPFGDESLKRSLGTAIIGNDRTGTNRIGNYDVTFLDSKSNILRKCRVEGFPRAEKSSWSLLYEALKNIYEGGCE